MCQSTDNKNNNNSKKSEAVFFALLNYKLISQILHVVVLLLLLVRFPLLPPSSPPHELSLKHRTVVYVRPVPQRFPLLRVSTSTSFLLIFQLHRSQPHTLNSNSRMKPPPCGISSKRAKSEYVLYYTISAIYNCTPYLPPNRMNKDNDFLV
jgi:hypothetical protein